MERKLILRKISEIIVDLQEQTHHLMDQTDPIDEIELEFFIANTKFLADHALILQKINAVSALPNTEEKRVIGVLEDLPETEEDFLEEEFEMDTEPAPEHNLMVEEPEIIPEPIFEESVEVELEPIAEPEMVIPAPAVPEPVYFAPETVVAEPKIPETENIKPTVNDLMAGQPEQNRAAKFSAEPVKDLKSIISLNDKLVFVKDLFSGYSLAYQEAIDTLNRLNDFDSADQYLQTNYVEKYKWAEQAKTVDRFYELLNRRFAK